MFLDIHWLRNATMLHLRLSVNMPVLSQTRQQEIRNSEIIAEAKHIMESRMFNKVEEVDVPVDTINIETTEKIATQAESISPSSNAQPSPSAVAPPTIGAGSTSTPASLHMVHMFLTKWYKQQAPLQVSGLSKELIRLCKILGYAFCFKVSDAVV